MNRLLFLAAAVVAAAAGCHCNPVVAQLDAGVEPSTCPDAAGVRKIHLPGGGLHSWWSAETAGEKTLFFWTALSGDSVTIRTGELQDDCTVSSVRDVFTIPDARVTTVRTAQLANADGSVYPALFWDSNTRLQRTVSRFWVQVPAAEGPVVEVTSLNSDTYIEPSIGASEDVNSAWLGLPSAASIPGCYSKDLALFEIRDGGVARSFCQFHEDQNAFARYLALDPSRQRGTSTGSQELRLFEYGADGGQLQGLTPLSSDFSPLLTFWPDGRTILLTGFADTAHQGLWETDLGDGGFVVRRSVLAPYLEEVHLVRKFPEGIVAVGLSDRGSTGHGLRTWRAVLERPDGALSMVSLYNDTGDAPRIVFEQGSLAEITGPDLWSDAGTSELVVESRPVEFK